MNGDRKKMNKRRNFFRKGLVIILVGMFLLTGITSLSAVRVKTKITEELIAQESSGGYGSIRGHVYLNKIGYEGATVEIYLWGDPEDSRTTTTNSNGYYKFNNVYFDTFNRNYVIKARCVGKEQIRIGSLIEPMPDWIQQFYFYKLNKGLEQKTENEQVGNDGYIYGTVYRNGEPLANACVGARNIFLYTPGHPEHGHSIQADSKGNYCIDGLYYNKFFGSLFIVWVHFTYSFGFARLCKNDPEEKVNLYTYGFN